MGLSSCCFPGKSNLIWWNTSQTPSYSVDVWFDGYYIQATEIIVSLFSSSLGLPRGWGFFFLCYILVLFCPEYSGSLISIPGLLLPCCRVVRVKEVWFEEIFFFLSSFWAWYPTDFGFIVGCSRHSLHISCSIVQVQAQVQREIHWPWRRHIPLCILY
jgi:hypothetical protein